MERILTTARTYLREFKMTDAEAVLRFNGDSRVTKYTGDANMVKKLPDAEHIIANIWLAEYQQHGYGRWAVVDRFSHQVIGFCGFKYIADLAMPDFGYRFLPEYWGKGFGSETALACKYYGQKELGISRYFADAMADNVASIKIIKRLGLKFSGYIEEDKQTYIRFTQRTPTLLNTNQFYK
ncbi:GNAT family N-acetyltransferase [Thalassotalea sp. ND16A]|uniref:GNAT family N-acetyltransferase n=1 Tax=Thalassotalea sp. ND16A TaxID=1535422 RepID=UPI00051A6368|nr:GNAT family N-acetyltransferase [Thalassotalea sp. ND16A]KGK00341.1 hypothetical protein ND16A_3548 [Thalassotalea sp. ND16A]